MPIYAYQCGSCGFAKDHLQRISDPALSDCPACGQSTFIKQLTAAGFQLKGSGWYATDFKGGSKTSSAGADAATNDSTAVGTTVAADAPANGGGGSGCAPSCACH
ncbi:MAG: zinc ribbon domain-containing protein [Betaproteobacteria bacterium]|nr:zinc ribbon domain-containing protein [Betaproteobacteria bacterium]